MENNQKMKTKNKPDKERKTPEEIKSAIVNELNKGPKSTSEISQAINSNWLTTEKFLSELIQEKKIIELISASKSKVYASLTDPAYFYLPLSEETRENTASLLKTIHEKWKEKIGKPLQKTILQKLAVEFVEQNKLEKEIPIARFHYGQTLVMSYEPGISSNLYLLKEDQEKSLNNLINKYENKSSTQAKILQYEKDSMKFYSEKEKIFSNFSPEKKDQLKLLLLGLSASYPSELTESFNLFDKLLFCIRTVINSEQYKEYLPQLKEVFAIFWDFATTEIYFYDIEKIIPLEKKELFSQIKSNYLNMKKTQITRIIEELENEVVLLDVPEKEISEFIHGLFQE